MIDEGTNPQGLAYKWTVCDITKTILEDGVTLYPGYIEVRDGQMFRFYSDDPNNSINPFLLDADGKAIGRNPEYQIGMLKNRVEFKKSEVFEAPEGAPNGHYVSQEILLKGIALRHKLTELEEAQKAEEAAQAVESAPPPIQKPDAQKLPECPLCELINGKEPTAEGIHSFNTRQHPYPDPAIVDNTSEVG